MGGKIYTLEASLASVIEIAPDPISRTNPIVKTKKKINATANPKILTWYRVTAIGNNNRISRSKTKKRIATK